MHLELKIQELLEITPHSKYSNKIVKQQEIKLRPVPTSSVHKHDICYDSQVKEVITDS